MASEPVVVYPRKFARERLGERPAPRVKPFGVFAFDMLQHECDSEGEARAVAQAFALDHPGAPVFVIERKASFCTATVVRESRP